jgi:H+/gluconate symporter-like permease
MHPLISSTEFDLTSPCATPLYSLVPAGRKIGTEGSGLTAVYIATAVLSEILTNNAAGAIMYPIAAIAGDDLGISPRKMSVAVMLGASAGFINPSPTSAT